MAAFGKSIGGRADGDIIVSATDNLKNQYSNPVSLGLGLAATALSLPRGGARVSANGASKNSARFQRYKADLAKAEKGSLFDARGGLKSEVIQASDEIIPGSKLGNKKLIELLTSDGSKIGDWSKMGVSYGTGKNRIQLHYYYNETTGRVYYYDYKTYLNNDYHKRTPNKNDFPDNEIRSSGDKK